MTLTFLLGGLFVLLSLGSQLLLNYFEQKPQIIVFFQDTKEEAAIEALVDKFKQNEKVASVTYVNKEAALAIYKEQFKNDPLLLEMVSADILPASIEVSATKIENLTELAASLKDEPDVQEIVFQEDVVKLLVSWTTAIRTIGLMLIIFLGLVSLFTVMTVTSMKIALKREEIEILRLVGASKGYIISPFVIEGVLYGVIGATIGWLVNVGILLYASPFLQTIFVGIPLFPISPLFYGYFFVGLITVGISLGFTASSLALSRVTTSG
jgi:cell division transport system permease protein